ncbi:MAG TPA: F-box-like domain-containing protein [Rhabdochlamydiaceae bacterium]|nr:F-box-like domain-containing protein [Rhabdochlamydiaceae bacterium]HSX13087.1 F-box-like domain-containing protein [Chlamydiales bacterium]
MSGRIEVSSLTVANKQEFLPPEGMESLPRDVILGIFNDYLDVKTQAICCRVSKSWKEINQKTISEIEALVSIFNKSIPTFIGYDFYTHNLLRKEIVDNDPKIQSLLATGDYTGNLETHSIAFEGNIDENGNLVVKYAPRDRELRAAVLEYNWFYEEAIKPLSEKKGDFKIEVIWRREISTFDGNYSQGRHFKEYPLTYDDHTHSVYRRMNLKISHISGSSSLAKTLNATCKFLNEYPIVSVADPDSDSHFKIYQAQIWSEPLLEGNNYTYI